MLPGTPTWGRLAAIAWIDLRLWEIDICLCAGAALAAATRVHTEGRLASSFAGAMLGDLYLYGPFGLIAGIVGFVA